MKTAKKFKQKPLDPVVKAVLQKFELDPKVVLWSCKGTWVMYHRYIEHAAALANIRFGMAPTIIESDMEHGHAAILVTGTMGQITEWSVGEASPDNNRNEYPWAMAEKRAKDRVALKLLGIHGLVYSEEEADFSKEDADTDDDEAAAAPEPAEEVTESEAAQASDQSDAIARATTIALAAKVAKTGMTNYADFWMKCTSKQKAWIKPTHAKNKRVAEAVKPKRRAA